MNLDAVLAACERLPALGVAWSSTAVSTVGWLPGIERMARERPPVRLALSLHAADEALRSELMPVNDRYPLRDVLAACLRWHERRRRPLFVEYLMLDRVNDRHEQALALAELLHPRRAFKVNLIRTTRPAPSSEARPPGRSAPSVRPSNAAVFGPPCGSRAAGTSTRPADSWPPADPESDEPPDAAPGLPRPPPSDRYPTGQAAPLVGSGSCAVAPAGRPVGLACHGSRPSAASHEPPTISSRPPAVATVKLSPSRVTP
jgi:hypothetical protein